MLSEYLYERMLLKMVHDFDIQLGVDGWYISQIITTTVESEWQHVQLSLHDFTDSEVGPKWLQ